MIINNRKISPSNPPYVIAEMSANHNGNIDNAYKIIDMAKNCGADAVKLQTYHPDTITFGLHLFQCNLKWGFIRFIEACLFARNNVIK